MQVFFRNHGNCPSQNQNTLACIIQNVLSGCEYMFFGIFVFFLKSVDKRK